jgi:protein-S-isoprenylcysteine O-methyltransferase Ste14
MAAPLNPASFAFSMLLAAPFLYFLVAGAKTFNVPERADAGAAWGQTSFISGSIAVFWTALHEGIHIANGVIGVAIVVLSISLYEWARRTVAARNFYIGLAGEVPGALCESGPYRYIRHPFYMSYMLAFLAMLVATPAVVAVVVFVCNVALFVYMALDDERTMSKSPLAEAYSKYANRVGKLLVLPGRR